MTNTADPQRPLDGLRVLSLEHAVAAPFCTRHLADMGARVIKVERPYSGDFARRYDERVEGMASYFVWLNRSKESLSLDIKTEQGQQILHELLAGTDVLVQNLAPGAAARLGLSFEHLHERYPRLIVCDISGYGEGGPYTDKKAYDLLIQSECGFLSVTGTADEMVKAGCSIADIATGMYAYSSILNALLLRHRTDVGTRIEVSMLEAMVELMGNPLYYAYQSAPPPVRSGAAHASIYPYGPFATGDGNTVMLGVQNEREWAAFCQDVLQQPSYQHDERFHSNAARTIHRAALQAIILHTFATLDAPTVQARLDAAGIAYAQANTMQQVWAHPQLQARKRHTQVASPVGLLPAFLPPGTNSAFEPKMGAIPSLGQHTRSILSELGYSANDQSQLQQLGVC